MADSLNVHDAKTHFFKLLPRVMLGEEIVIARAGDSLARLIPERAPVPARRVPWNEANPRLSPRVRPLLPGFRGAASVYMRARLNHFGIKALAVTLDHVLASSLLPPYHRDPFDRILVAQRQVERLAIVTRDAEVQKHALETIW